jgi:PAS domain S-box-containing protein
MNTIASTGLQGKPPGSRGTALPYGINSLAIFLCLGVGLTLSYLLYLNFSRADEERLHERVLRGTQTLAAYSIAPPTPLLLETFAVLDRARNELMANPQMSAQVLESYWWQPTPPATEMISVRYMPKVRWNAANARFEMLNLAGQVEPFTTPIIDAVQTGPEPTDSQRDEYFPIQTYVDGGRNLNVLGLNHFYDETFHIAMDQARDSGLVTSRTAFPIGDEVELFVISHCYIALYSPGAMPTTIAERRARHTGFLSLTTFAPAEAFIDFLPDSYRGLETTFFVDTPAFSSDNQDAEFRRIMGNPIFAHAQFESGGLTTHILARPSLSLERSIVSPNRWWALGIGMLVTAWVCSMMLWIRHNAGKLSLLVNERTRDLAERTRALSDVNTALRQSEMRYRMLADNASDVIFTHDMMGICTYISPSITQHNGYTVEEYLGRPIYAYMPEKSAAHVKTVIDGLRTSPASVALDKPVEFQTWCKDGRVRTMECTLSRLYAADGTPTGFLGVSRDITERKKNEQEKVALEEAVRQSQKMEAIGTLAGGVAHDFNNLLTGILGHAELLKERNASRQELERSVDVIETAAIRAKELTTQLLGFARKGRFQAVPVNLNALLAETIALLERTIDKSIRISSSVAGEKLIVTGEPSQISQILLNLAVNARDAMPQGGRLIFELDTADVDATFNAARFDTLTPGRYCVLSVSDTGIGITRDKLDRIFEPFFTDKPDGKGTGLGLAMVYGVVKNHGGTVRVYSEPGNGTVFRVYLPLTEAVSDVLPEKVFKQPVAGKGRILVVDDETVIRNLAELMLQKLGYTVVCAEDGRSAVEYYERHWPDIDLVIADMIMPNMGGLDCLRRMKNLNPGLKAILATGYSHDAIDDKARVDYIFGFLQKPFTFQELSELVASVTRMPVEAIELQAVLSSQG